MLSASSTERGSLRNPGIEAGQARLRRADVGPPDGSGAEGGAAVPIHSGTVADYGKTTVLLPLSSTRSSRCQRRPRASTVRSTSRPTRRELLGGVPVVDAPGVLLDDGALVQLGRHVVAGGADQLHAPLEGLVVGPGPGEGGQERVVDVDDAPGPGGAEARGRICMYRARTITSARSCSKMRSISANAAALASGRPDRHAPEPDAVPFDQRPEVLVVRDHAHDVALELPRPPAIEEVGDAVVLPVREQHDPLAHVGVGQVPFHVELRRHRFEGGGHLRGTEPRGEAVRDDLYPQEEAPALQVAVLGRLEDRPAVAGDQAGDGGHDAERSGHVMVRT